LWVFVLGEVAVEEEEEGGVLVVLEEVGGGWFSLDSVSGKS
jgi:hypothetical protein